MWTKYSELLQKRHPELFFDPQCDNGWFEIIDRLMSSIECSLVSMGLHVDQWPSTIQIKEKFGTLRYYIGAIRAEPSLECEQVGIMTSIRPVSDIAEIDDLIRDAEQQTAHTCERCGCSGELITSGWVHTYCDDCEKWYNSRVSYEDGSVEIPYAESLILQQGN